MNERKMRKKSKIERPYFMHKIGGDHIVRFYFDMRSGHPFMAITKEKDTISGHEMTTTPPLTKNNTIKSGYIRFRRKPNRHQQKKSYYKRRIKRRLQLSKSSGRFKIQKNWAISRKDLKVLKNVDKKKIKNVRIAKN